MTQAPARNLQDFFLRKCVQGKHSMAPFAETLRSLAGEHQHVAEIGIRWCAATVPLLLGLPKDGRLYSCDIEHLANPQDWVLEQCPTWSRHYISSLEWEWPCEMDMLLIDGHHTFEQVQGELDRFADRVRRTLVFHDSIAFGSQGGGLPSQTKGRSLGIRPAIDNLMIRDSSWQIHAHDTRMPGLLTLRRCGA